MKRKALGHIYKIMNETVNGCVQPESFPERCLEPIDNMERALHESIMRCEARKKDFAKSYYIINKENNLDLQNEIYSLGKRGIDIPLWCLLLMCAIHELDNEVLSLQGKVDQLEAEKIVLEKKITAHV